MELALEELPVELVECTSPLLIGVRHHSAAMSRIIPELLDEFKPERILLELPVEFADWLPWLAHDETEAPVALAGVQTSISDLGFYPFADFSPELSTIRWAHKNNIEIIPFDLPMAVKNVIESEPSERSGLVERLNEKFNCRDSAELWEVLVETPAVTAPAEEVRRSALYFGWAMRCDNLGKSDRDLIRESYMRNFLNSDKKTAAVIGSYHAAALLPEPLFFEEKEIPEPEDSKVVTSMIPYNFSQLDQRSGYPAGICDPVWQQAVFESADADEMVARITGICSDICREIRRLGHPGSTADLQEVVRFTRDLGTMRNFKVPGRKELLEALTSCMARGELLGAGRILAKALEEVMIGSCGGTLPQNTPRSGLAPYFEQLIADLKLPGPETIADEPKTMRIDSAGSNLERCRCLLFNQLQVVGIPYAERIDEGQVHSRENLTFNYNVGWQAATSAMLELAGIRGVTIEQIVIDRLNQTLLDNEPSLEDLLQTLERGAECAVRQIIVKAVDLLNDRIEEMQLQHLIKLLYLYEKLNSRHYPGMTELTGRFTGFTLDTLSTEHVLEQSVITLEGLAGSDLPEDVSALLELITCFQKRNPARLSDGRLTWSLENMEKTGSHLMQGASCGVQLLIELKTSEEISSVISSVFDGADSQDGIKNCRDFLAGLAITAESRLTSDFSCLEELNERLHTVSDKDFLRKLPPLRGGFNNLSPGARQRLFDLVSEQTGENKTSIKTQLSPAESALNAELDELSWRGLEDLFPSLSYIEQKPSGEIRRIEVNKSNTISPADRWRLILGQKRNNMPASCMRAARALDELYGQGKGEGSGQGGSGQGGGQEDPFPTAREWSDELLELFGTDVREDVMATAAAEGRINCLDQLDPSTVSPSVDLLEQILSLKGSMGEKQLEKLRPFVKRIIQELIKELAIRVQPALHGLRSNRITRRNTRRVNLNHTIKRNLHTAREKEDGTWGIAPEYIIFNSGTKKALDWELYLVLDISGSMEPSVIYSAMMAAIFSGIPALNVKFLAFNTQVVDFSDKVDDPLSLLLEVNVGGGTHIAKGVNAARNLIKNPSRSLLVLITDFEEGFSVGELLSEIEALHHSNVKMLGIAALDDSGAARYHKGIASQVAAAGMPVSALSPLQLARWVGEQIK